VTEFSPAKVDRPFMGLDNMHYKPNLATAGQDCVLRLFIDPKSVGIGYLENRTGLSLIADHRRFMENGICALGEKPAVLWIGTVI